MHSNNKIFIINQRRRKGGIDVTRHSKEARRKLWNYTIGIDGTDQIQTNIIEDNPISRNVSMSFPSSIPRYDILFFLSHYFNFY